MLVTAQMHMNIPHSQPPGTPQACHNDAGLYMSAIANYRQDCLAIFELHTGVPQGEMSDTEYWHFILILVGTEEMYELCVTVNQYNQ